MLEGVTGQPGRIVAAGDWHGNQPWAVAKIRAGAELLDGEPRKVFLHFGDFGFWPDTWGWYTSPYLRAVSAALAAADAVMLVVDGNHENHDMLAAVASGDALAGVGPPHQVVPRVYWLPRGFRWVWHDRTWVAIGGAASVDRALRAEGSDWFSEEEISDEQEAAIIAPGPADVIVSHDCPSGVAHGFPPPPPAWHLRDLARADRHRERVQRIGESLRAGTWMHGHLHMAYQRTTDLGWGPVTVTGLDRDGCQLNTAVLDVRDMSWAPYE